MTMLLVLCVLAAGVWLASSVAARLSAGSPTESADAHGRALRALAPGPAPRPPTTRRR